MEDNKHVAIVGSGPTGSTLAIILAQKGYKVDIFEKRDDPTDGRFKEAGRSFNLSVSKRALYGWKRANVD
jgi:kynurenine 3-monooxygenase